MDAYAPPKLFHFPRLEALRLGCCARCGLDVDPSSLDDMDAREYRISALCPGCWDTITADCE